MIGSVIYHALDVGERLDLIPALLEAARPAMGGQPFTGYRSIEAGSDKHSRWRSLSPSNLEQLRADLLGRVLSAVHFDVVRGAEREEAYNLDLSVNPPPTGVRKSVCPYNVKLVAPRRSSEAVADFAAACRAIWELVESPYGLIYPGVSHDDVYMELTAVPSTILGEAISPQMETRLKWLGFWQQYQDEIGAFVRTAYWGNLLGCDLVDRLGDLRTVIESAPAAVAQPVGRGGAYLQASLNAYPAAEHAQARLRLAQYLKPVSLAFKHPNAAPAALA